MPSPSHATIQRGLSKTHLTKELPHEVNDGTDTKSTYGAAPRTCAQVQVAKIICNQRFDLILGIIVMVNLGFVVVETNLNAKSTQIPDWMISLTRGMLAFYSLEVCARLFVERRRFFLSFSNILDLWIVTADLVIEFLSMWLGTLPSLAVLRVLRIFRALRVLRAIRVLPFFRELYIMMHGFVAAMKAIMWATILLGLMLIILSIVAVEAIHPVNIEVAELGTYDGCARCPQAFESIEASVVTLVQNVVAGDSWGQVTIPLMEYAPWTAVYFCAVLVSVQLGMMNLILSVIVDKAAQAQEEDEDFVIAEREARYHAAKRYLLSYMKDLDTDEDGDLTLAEIYDGFDGHEQFHQEMLSLDVQREDLETVFKLMDETKCGHVQYTEFVEELHQLKKADNQKTMLYLRASLFDISCILEAQVTDMMAKLERHSEDVFLKMQAQEDKTQAVLTALDTKMVHEEHLLHEVEEEIDTEAGTKKNEGKLVSEEQKQGMSAVNGKALSAHAPVTEAATASERKTGAGRSAAGVPALRAADDLQMFPELQSLRKRVEEMHTSLTRMMTRISGRQDRLLMNPATLIGVGIRNAPDAARLLSADSQGGTIATTVEIPNVRQHQSQGQPFRGIAMPSCCSVAPGNKSGHDLVNLQASPVLN